ncbi:MAG: alpha/beta hydrolase family protein, partial [Homavirus sp.]
MTTNKIIIIVVSIVILLCILRPLLYKIECKLLFVPTKVNSHHSYNLDYYEKKLQKEINKDIRVYEKTISIDRNNKVNTVYFHNPNTKYTILYAHGNGGYIGNCLDVSFKFLHYASFILFDYRGYGKSVGTNKNIVEQDLYNDIWAVWKYVVYNLEVDPNSIILYGHSLGSSVVAWLGYKL